MAVELSSDAQRWLGRLPEIVNLVLIALIALSAAQLFWQVWPQPDVQAVAPAGTPGNARAADQNTIDANAIASAHLFGEQKTADADLEKQKELNAPETQLNLVLTGIVADSNGRQSRALIKNPQGKQDSYRVDQQIVSGVDLHAIYPDRVILDRSGRFETLTLESLKKAQGLPGLQRTSMQAPDSGPTSATAASTPGASTQRSSTAPAGTTAQASADLNQQLSDIRQKILANPASAQRYIRLRPAREDGNLIGYRIFPGQDKSLFEKAGLKSGELVTAINGQPLDNPAASLKMLGNLAHAASASITVQNDDETRTVQVDFQ